MCPGGFTRSIGVAFLLAALMANSAEGHTMSVCTSTGGTGSNCGSLKFIMTTYHTYNEGGGTPPGTLSIKDPTGRILTYAFSDGCVFQTPASGGCSSKLAGYTGCSIPADADISCYYAAVSGSDKLVGVKGDETCKANGYLGSGSWATYKAAYVADVPSATTGTYELWTSGTDQQLDPCSAAGQACRLADSSHITIDIAVANCGTPCQPFSGVNISGVTAGSNKQYTAAVGSCVASFDGAICSDISCSGGFQPSGNLKCAGGVIENNFACVDTQFQYYCSAAVDCSAHGTTSDIDNRDGCDCTCDAGYTGYNCGVLVTTTTVAATTTQATTSTGTTTTKTTTSTTKSTTSTTRTLTTTTKTTTSTTRTLTSTTTTKTTTSTTRTLTSTTKTITSFTVTTQTMTSTTNTATTTSRTTKTITSTMTTESSTPTTTTTPCAHLSGTYQVALNGFATGTDTLTQGSLESGTVIGCMGSSDYGWTYSVDGLMATLFVSGEEQASGEISGSAGSYTIKWTSGYVYTPCTDLTGTYRFALSTDNGIVNGTDTLTQSGCSGSSLLGWTYTVNGVTATLLVSGVQQALGVISGSAGSYTIRWSSGYVYTPLVSTSSAPLRRLQELRPAEEPPMSSSSQQFSPADFIVV